MQNNNQEDPGNFSKTDTDIADPNKTAELQTHILEKQIVDAENKIVVRKSGASNMVHQSGYGQGSGSVQTPSQIQSLNSKAESQQNRAKVDTCKEWCKTALSEISFDQYDSAYNFICECLKEMESIAQSR